MGYVPDNHDIDRYVINERDRLERYLKRFEKEESEEKEDERIISNYKSETGNY